MAVGRKLPRAMRTKMLTCTQRMGISSLAYFWFDSDQGRLIRPPDNGGPKRSTGGHEQECGLCFAS